MLDAVIVAEDGAESQRNDRLALLVQAGVDVLVRDGWAPYRRFAQTAHQTCLAHLLRRSRQLASDHPRAAWPARVAEVLQQALAVRDRRDNDNMTAHGAAIARGRLFNDLTDLVNCPVRTAALQRFATHLAVELPAVFGFLFDPTIDATNWKCSALHFQLNAEHIVTQS